MASVSSLRGDEARLTAGLPIQPRAVDWTGVDTAELEPCVSRLGAPEAPGIETHHGVCAGRTGQRPARCAASPRLAQQRGRAACSPVPSRAYLEDGANTAVPGALHCSPTSTCSSPQSVALLIRIVDALQSDKAGLDAQLACMRGERDRLEAENARLR